MLKKSKLISLIASLTVSVVFILTVLLIMIATGKVSASSTKLVFTSESITAPYTGQTLRASGWTLKQGEIKDGHTLSVTVSGQQTNAGTSENYITAVIKDSNGIDVTGDYDIEYIPGTITVKAQPLKIIAASAEIGNLLPCPSFFSFAAPRENQLAGVRLNFSFTASVMLATDK